MVGVAHTLLFQLLGLVPESVVPVLDDQERGVVGRVHHLDVRLDDPVILLPLDDACADRPTTSRNRGNR